MHSKQHRDIHAGGPEACKTWVTINIAALRNNLRCLAQAVGPDRPVILVVKANAYGHDARTVVETAAAEGYSHFAVASVDEGVMLRRFGVEGEILLLHPPLLHELDRVIEWRLTPSISDIRTAEACSSKLAGGEHPIHIEINTGMNRLGLDYQTAAETIARIADLPHLQLAGLFTHFRTAAPTDTDAVTGQMARFAQVRSELAHRGIDPGTCHAASSYVLAYHRETLCDAVRPGLIAYGGFTVDPDKTTHPILTRIEPVMSVHTRILHLRQVAAGEWLHYGDAYRTTRALRVAVLPIGYGMGYSRHLTNSGCVLINGQRAPILGTIGMDMTIVDCDRLDSLAVGDTVTILGRDGRDQITAEDIAGWSGTIPYEVTCRLGNGLPRVVPTTGTESEAGTTRTVPSVR